MQANKYSVSNVLMYSLLLSLVSVLSCTGFVKQNEPPANSQLSAEYSMMKKRLPLIERENDVLKKENLQHRSTIQDLESQIKRLDLELTALREKYATDTSAAAEQISSLQESMQKLEQDSTERIEALNARNKAQETKLGKEIHALKEKSVQQKAAFDREREQIIQEHEAKQSRLKTQLDNLKKTMEPKDLEISSLKKAIAEISIQLGEASTLTKTLKKARDEAQAELDAARTANAELMKKVNALNHELSLRNNQSQTNH